MFLKVHLKPEQEKHKTEVNLASANHVVIFEQDENRIYVFFFFFGGGVSPCLKLSFLFGVCFQV